jgi:DNA polymerase elongation subunit (family B)
MKIKGWLLDVYINSENAVLWFKLENGQTLRLTDLYRPNFYVETKENTQTENLANIIHGHPNILHASTENKFTSINKKQKIRVLHIYIDYPKNFGKVLNDIKKLRLTKAFYNIGLLHVQRYLFQKNVAPTNKVKIKYDKKFRLRSLQVLKGDWEIKPPPFTSLIFDMEIKNNPFTPDVNKDPVSKIIIFNEGMNLHEVFEGTEGKILSKLAKQIKLEDPDFLILPDAASTLEYILERVRILKLNLQFGREKTNIFKLTKLIPYALKGRICLDLHTFLQIGIAGVTERSRFTVAPSGLSAKWPAGKTIDSRQCFEALNRDILIPQNRSNFKYLTTAKNIIFKDKGGLILSPKTGLHENVGELDYESMYPQIIIKHNVSYETVTPSSTEKHKKGFLGEFTEKVLKRRFYFKHLKKKYNKKSQEYLWCEHRQLALKGILVCIYGYSGCFANRFSNVATYEEVNRVARHILVKTLNIALSKGFKIIYGDSDSIFIKKKNAKKQDYENLRNTIQKETDLRITLDRHYKFLVLLPKEADPDIEATKRYFGKLMSGDLHYRGIELRRHDYPVFLKQFQKKLLEILFDAKDAELVKREQYQKAYNYVTETCNKVARGKIAWKKLIVSKVLRKPVKEYKSALPHVIAALQLIQKGKKVKTGEVIDFLYVNTAHINPFRRVVPAAILNSNYHYYDKKKYSEMVLDVAETVLNVFGFNRKQLRASLSFKNYKSFHKKD